MTRTSETLFALLAVTMALTAAGTGSAQPQQVIKAETPQITYKFGPQGQVGLTVNNRDRKIPLTFSDAGFTSSTVMRINGQDVVFGSPQGKWKLKTTPLAKEKGGPKRFGHWSTWSYGKIKASQVVEVLPSDTGRMDTCLIYYILENTDNQPHFAGLRTMIDTQINDNDGNSFAVAGRAVVNQANFKTPKSVPDAIEVRETSDPTQFGFIAHLTLKVRGGFEAPDRVILTHWPGVSTKWEVPLTDMGEDSAVTLYWNPRQINGNGRCLIGYAYGQGILHIANTGN